MRAVKSSGTAVELSVRRLCRELGESGYRLHRSDLPGTPDLAYVGKRLVIFVHGCFWHGHTCKAGAKTVKTNADYWGQKIQRNIKRDRHNLDALAKLGWRALELWECEVRDVPLATRKLTRFLRRR